MLGPLATWFTSNLKKSLVWKKGPQNLTYLFPLQKLTIIGTNQKFLISLIKLAQSHANTLLSKSWEKYDRKLLMFDVGDFSFVPRFFFVWRRRRRRECYSPDGICIVRGG